MKHLIIILIFLVGCSKTIQTSNGKVELDRSYNSSIFSKKIIESKIEKYTRRCNKCGMCFSMGKFKWNCMCSGRRDMTSKFSYFTIIYKYTSPKNPDIYKTIPRTVREHVQTIKRGSCR